MTTPPGRFVVVEGPEGAGKTTLVERLADRLREVEHAVLVVREPGSTESGEAARRLVLDPTLHWGPAAELFLMLAARTELVARVIRPALREGTTVISDRFELSTLAYQVAGRGLDRNAVAAANRLATGGLRPDLTLVLDVSPAIGRQRQRGQGKAPDRIEQADDQMHARVADAFRRATGTDVVHLDADRPVNEVATEAWQHVAEILGLSPSPNT